MGTTLQTNRKFTEEYEKNTRCLKIPLKAQAAQALLQRNFICMKNWQTRCKMHETGEQISPTGTVVDQFCHYTMSFWQLCFFALIFLSQ